MRRKLLVFFSLFILLYQVAAAQQDCINAIPLCGNNYSSGPWVTGGGSIRDLNPGNRGCLDSGEANTAWYVINIAQSGTLVFTLEPIGTTISDYDFAIWDVTGSGTTRGCGPCDIVHNNTPVRCNWRGLALPYTHAQCLTGLSYTSTVPSVGVNGPQFSSALPVTAGQTFIIGIDNTGGFPINPFTLDFSGSTASITDTVLPAFRLANSPCGYGSDVLIATMSEPVKTSSIAANGSDFYLTDAAGNRYNVQEALPTELNPAATFTINVSLRLAAALPAGNYTLHAQRGTDGNTLLDHCGNEQQPADNLAFTLGVPLSVPVITAVDTPACTRARLIISRPVMCSTIAADGSDFRITGPSAVRVTGARPRVCRSFPSAGCGGTVSLSDTIDLVFDGAIRLPGTYRISVVTGNDGNAITDSCLSGIGGAFEFVVSDGGYLSVSAPSAVICQPGYVTLIASLTVPATAVKPGFTWTPGSYMSDSTVNNPVVYVPATTTYTAQVTDTSGCHRRVTSTITVSVRDARIAGRDTGICTGEAFIMTASGGGTYQWYPAAGLSCTSCADPVASPRTSTTYTAVITDGLGCADTLHRTIRVHELPFVDAGRDTTIIYGTSLQLYAYSPAGKYYYWDPIAGMSNANIPNPVVTPRTSMSYVVFVADTNYCRNSDTLLITVRTDVKVTVPSGFTPNGDGHNDLFRVTNLTFHKIAEFRVFNRWGQEVFTALDNKGWDGMVNGAPADAGNYQYLIRVAYPDGRAELLKGDVTLIR